MDILEMKYSPLNRWENFLWNEGSQVLLFVIDRLTCTGVINLMTCYVTDMHATGVLITSVCYNSVYS